MIFGYNTEVREGETVYHVQSEARAYDMTLQTQVFVKGCCVSKRSTPYTDVQQDLQAQELLRLQHRSVLQCLQLGRLDQVNAPSNDLGAAVTRNTQPDSILTCTQACREAGELVLRFQLNRNGMPAPNQRLRCSWTPQGSDLAPRPLSEMVSNRDGVAELRLAVDPPPGVELLVELEAEGCTKLRRFRLQPSGTP